MQGDPVSVRELNAVLERTPFLEPYGFSVQSRSDGECVLHVAFAPAPTRGCSLTTSSPMYGPRTDAARQPITACAPWMQRSNK